MQVKIKLTRAENCEQYNVPIGGVVSLDLEDEYLPICVSSEIYESNTRTAMEAKKAQAIAARTYLAAHVLSGTTIDDTTKYQAFKWKKLSSIPNCVQACKDTAGLVLTHGAAPITAWYSNSNGGRTKRSDEAWSAYKPWTDSKLDPWDQAGREKWGQVPESHGVGMSQIGAAFAGWVGYTCEQILEFYYPNTAIVGNYGEGSASNMGAKTNTGLAAHAQKMLSGPYWYGTFCNRATTALLNSKTLQYPSHYTESRRSRHEKDIRNGALVSDCIGLMKGYIWENDAGVIIYDKNTDVNTTGLYNASTVKGPISAMPEVPGLMMYKTGHVGVYIGNGKVIEARSYESGIVESNVKTSSWTHWIAVPWISYQGYEDMLRPPFDGAYTALVITQSTPLNIRDKPLTTGTSIGKVNKGDTLTVTGHAAEIGWAKVKKEINGMLVEGYSDVKYLQRVGDASPGDVDDNKDDEETGAVEPPNDQPLYQATVINVTNGLNLRLAPNKEAGNTIVLMPLGVMVDVYADNVGDGFALVQYGKVFGYCTRSYLLQVSEEIELLYDVHACGVSRSVVEKIRAVYPGAVFSETKK